MPYARAVLRLPKDPGGSGPLTPWPVRRKPGQLHRSSLLFQACLGLELYASRVSVISPALDSPASLGELRIHNLEVAGATIDLLLVRHQHNVSVNVLRREGDVEIPGGQMTGPVPVGCSLSWHRWHRGQEWRENRTALYELLCWATHF